MKKQINQQLSESQEKISVFVPQETNHSNNCMQHTAGQSCARIFCTCCCRYNQLPRLLAAVVCFVFVPALLLIRRARNHQLVGAFCARAVFIDGVERGKTTCSFLQRMLKHRLVLSFTANNKSPCSHHT